MGANLADLRASKPDSIRAICYGERAPFRRRIKTWIKEFQINGGSIEDKIDYVYKLFEKPVSIGDVFKVEENIDTIAITKGKGNEGVITRWGVTRLPRKTHRGLRKVACIGSWHPSRVSYSVARVGQNGYHHRTEIHKKIYLMAKGVTDEKGNTNFNATTEADPTQKTITPLGGFPRYGTVQ